MTMKTTKQQKHPTRQAITQPIDGLASAQRWIRRAALLLALALPSLCAQSALAEAPATAEKSLTRQDFLDQATQASHGEQTIQTLPDGSVRMRVPLQALEARIGTKGAQLHSINAGGNAGFGWQLAAWGREDDAEGRMQKAGRGSVSTEAERVTVTRGDLQEHFTASSNGLRQDFVIAKRPAGTNELVLRMAVQGATLQTLQSTDQAVAVKLDDGRLLHYHALQVTDVDGKSVPARMQVAGEQMLRIAVNDAGARYPLLVDPTFSDADWTAIAGPDFDGGILASVFGNGILYVAGSFSSTPNGPASNVAQWDGTTWSALGAGTNYQVSALAWDASGGRLFAGGIFTEAGGVNANKVAQWNGSTWTAVGSGMSHAVHALAWDANDGRLVAGGDFTSAGGVSASHIAQWTGSDWSALGTGMDNSVYALAWNASGSRLIAGGDFGSASGVAANYIAQWNGTAWAAMGSGMNGSVHALVWNSGGDRLFAGGRFTTAGGSSVNFTAQWNGSTWSALGSGGVGAPVYSLAWDASGGRLFAGGLFAGAAGVNANFIAQWNGSAWSALGSGMNNQVRALAWDAGSGRLFAGGSFTLAGEGVANKVAQWNGSTWTAMGTGANGGVKAVVWDPSAGRLFAGGDFTSIGGVSANYIAQWDGSVWSALGAGVNSSVLALAWDASANQLFAGGDFTSAGGLSAKRIARWSGSSWSALGTGMNTAVFALVWDTANGRLFAGGAFTSAGGNAANYIAQWNGSTWSALGAGLVNFVNALAWDAVNNRLFVGGTFNSAGGSSPNFIAQWNGSVWSGLGLGANNVVSALAWDATNNRLFAGGSFTSVGGNAANNIAQWNGSTWSSLGTGANNTVSTLAWDATNNRLIAGGSFTSAGGSTANHIAQWNGSTWSALGSGADNVVNALTWDAASNRLFAGGNFATAGGKLARIAFAKLPTTYTLNYSAGPNGSITGTTPQIVDAGDSGTTVAATPSAGYHFTHWSDNVLTATRTDSNVAADLNVTANFAMSTYTLSYSTDGNGVISGNRSQLVVYGSLGSVITALPNTGYHFVQWSDGNTNATRWESNVTASANFTASFAINTYTLTYTSGANGSITGATPQTVDHNASGTAVTATPAAGYRFDKWSDGNTNATRTDANVTADVTVIGSFIAKTYTLTYTAGAHGSIIGTSPQTVSHNASGSAVTATPATGYRFDKWSDGNTNAMRADANVSSDLSVTAMFAANSGTHTGTLPNGSQATATLSNAGGTCLISTAQFTSNLPAGAPQGYNFPYGAFRFEAEGCPGNTTVRVQYDTPLPADVVFYKYGPQAANGADEWFVLLPTEIAINAARDTVTYVVADNGRGDGDASANKIRDPFIVALKAAAPVGNATPVPTLGVIGVALLSLMAGVFGAWRIRGRGRLASRWIV